jgi:aminoglycoside 3-N-acetyltransferase
MITRYDIANDLRRLGVADGDILLVHSSLSSLGAVEGGADTVIDALLDTIGPAGTLLMPSFQSGREYDLVRQGCVFDVRSSPSQMGLISETFRRRGGVVRSLSPTHCTAGLGPQAVNILEGHQYCTVSVGHESPYEKFVTGEGKVLLLGVEHNANTTLHLVENIHGAPTVSPERFEPVVIDANGKPWEVPTYPHVPGLQRHYQRAEAPLLQAGIQVNGTVGKAAARLIDVMAMERLLGLLVEMDPYYLCDTAASSTR